MLMATNSPGILIVDDNEDNRYTLQLMLETDGHERIASAAGGNEAIALIEKEKFSLILLDLMMPDLNGDEVLKVINAARLTGRRSFHAQAYSPSRRIMPAPPRSLTCAPSARWRHCYSIRLRSIPAVPSHAVTH